MKYRAISFCSLSLIFILASCNPTAEQENTQAATVVSGSPTLPGEMTPTSVSLAPATGSPSPTSTSAHTPSPPQPAPPSPEPSPTLETPVPAVNLPDPSSATWSPVSLELSSPVDIVYSPDGSGRLFVLEQQGRIRILQNGELDPAPFLDIADRVGSSGLEQGLLGMAFHPSYPENEFFYLNYIDRNGNTVIARYSVSADPNQADPGSEFVLLRVDQPFPNHNGGGVVFGPDGYLYLSLGDGGSGGDPMNNAQSLNTLLGKLLRIDVDHGDPYAIPADNPFASGGGLGEIWAYGLRNPWRFSFDRGTGDLYIGDVGQNSYEEIDYLPAGTPGGVNFGWNYREGRHSFRGNPPQGLELTDPVLDYELVDGNCSVIGGYVYRGASLPDWNGVYLYGDWCSGRIWGLIHLPDGSWQNGLLFQTDARISSFGEDQAGELYLVDRQGRVLRLESR